MNNTTMIEFKDVTSAVYRLFDHKYKLQNSYVFTWESDYFGISTSGYAYEIEIKMSKSDFKADFKKTDKHRLLKYGHMDLIPVKAGRAGGMIEENGKRVWRDNYTKIDYRPPIVPHRFFYACPENLIDVADVPDYAGLIYVGENGTNQIKAAPLIHKRKLDLARTLRDKFYYESINLRNTVNNLRYEIERLQWQLNNISEEEMQDKQLKLI